MKLTKTVFFLIVIGVICSAKVSAQLSVAKLFSDHMVLQRDEPVKIWGTTKAKANVEVCLPDNCFNTKAGGDGSWTVVLPSHSAAGPLNITVSSGATQVEVADIYFGDVWLAGGQSNMEWSVASPVANKKAELADSNYPEIRFFNVKTLAASTPMSDFSSGSWQVASRKTVPNFSAVAWLFAKKYHIEKGVAIGIISNNKGGSRAETWVSRTALLTLPSYQEKTKALYADTTALQGKIVQNKHLQADKNYRLHSVKEANKTAAFTFGYNDSHWQTVSFPTKKNFNSIVWLRKTITLKTLPKAGITLDFGDIDELAMIYFNEKLIANEAWNVKGSRHVIPMSQLRVGENLIALRIAHTWRKGPRIGLAGEIQLINNDQQIMINDDWTFSDKVEKPFAELYKVHHQPSLLYNGMIAPMAKYGLRGVIWYQGESNVGQAALYGDLFKALIQDWRSVFGENLPFLYVQIAGFNYYGDHGDENSAELRYQQQLALSLPFTGMATAFDIGVKNDIHPQNKQDVAARLWLAAKQVVFNDRVIAQAPTVNQYHVNGGKVKLSFTTPRGKLKLSNDATVVNGFEIAGANGEYLPANGVLENNQIILKNSLVSKPVSIRYAWAGYTDVNLYSEFDLPVLPFQILLKK